MVNLGLWQLDRLDQRRAFNATIEARYDARVARAQIEALIGRDLQ